MAINRYYTPAQSQPFDPYVVDTATMYGNLRQAGYENLLAKQQLDVSTQDEVGKALDSLKAFTPENNEVLVALNTGKTVTEKSKLPDYYNNITSQIYKGASDLATKYNNNYASPEAQREVSDYLKQVKSYLPTLQEIKNSDKALGEQNKITQKHLNDTPLTELEGTLGEYNSSIRGNWVNPNDNTFHTAISSPTKGVDLIKGASAYIADNLIKNYSKEDARKLGIVTDANGVKTFDITKVDNEYKTRLMPQIQELARNYINSNKEHIHNVGLEGLQMKDLTQGLKDSSDAESTYSNTMKSKEEEFLNRFKEFRINDYKHKENISSSLLPGQFSGGSGSPNTKDFGLTQVEGVKVNNKNFVPFTAPKLNSDGSMEISVYKGPYTSKQQGVTGGAGGTAFSPLTSGPNGGWETKKIQSTDDVITYINQNPNVKQAYINLGYDINDPKNLNTTRLKDVLDTTIKYNENYKKLSTNALTTSVVNNPFLNEQLNRLMSNSTLRIGDPTGLPISDKLKAKLKELEASSADGAITGDQLKSAIKEVGEGYEIKDDKSITHGVTLASGTNRTPVTIQRSLKLVKYNGKDSPEKEFEIPIIQDYFNPSLNNEPVLHAIDSAEKLISSGANTQAYFNEGKPIDLGGGYSLDATKIPNHSKRSFDLDKATIYYNGKALGDYKTFRALNTDIFLNDIKNDISTISTKESEGQRENSQFNPYLNINTER